VNERVANLQDFTLEFFRHCNTAGPTTGPTSGPAIGGSLRFIQDEALYVKLNDELTQYFNRPELLIVFNNQINFSEINGSAHTHEDLDVENLTPDLVAYGSRTFDLMMAYLDKKSALTLQQLPSRLANSEIFSQAIQPVNATITNLKLKEQTERLFIFNWRITYRADDKQEEIFTVVLDADGNRQNHIEKSEEAEAEHPLNLATLFADAEPVPPRYNEEGQPLLPRLPPMTQLNRLAESARKYATYHADRNCSEHEAEIMPRLQKSLERLTNYYEKQIEEVRESDDQDGEKRTLLQQDLERKRAEEVENHRLRVRVHLSSYAILEVPMVVADMVLGNGKQEIPIEIYCNRYNGVIRRPHCHSCDSETAQIAIDRNDHITCDACLEQCASCLELLCQSCGVEACPDCEKTNCETCSEFCWACGGRACTEHTSRCPRCADTVCHSCQTACASCGTRQCRTHLRFDCVTEQDPASTTHAATSAEPVEAEPALRQAQGTLGEGERSNLICPECAVRCTGCQQYSAHSENCDTSGQRFCANCMATCVGCQRRIGSNFYLIYPLDGKAYCTDCLVTCSSCQTMAPAVEKCSFCDEDGCYKCGNICTICNAYGCPDHTHKHGGCGHVMCIDHQVACSMMKSADPSEPLCLQPLCIVCDPTCQICESYACPEHQQNCTLCGQAYCENCITSKRCSTCETALMETDLIDFSLDEYAEDEQVLALQPQKYRWVQVDNLGYTIYLGKNALSNAMIVVHHQEEESVVVKAEKMKSIELIGNRMRRKRRG